MKKFNILVILLLSNIIIFACTAIPSSPFESGDQLPYPQKVIVAGDHDKTNSVVTLDVLNNNQDLIDNRIDESNPLLINTLNTNNEAQSYPWLSDDGLRVYYTHGTSFYTATRESIDGKFNKGENIISDFDETIISGWLSPDELSVYITTQSSVFYKGSRSDKNSKFSTFKEVKLTNAPAGSLFDASFTPDMNELLLYKGGELDKIVSFEKVNEYEYIFKGALDLGTEDAPTGGQLSRDGLRLYIPFMTDPNTYTDFRKIYVYSRTNTSEKFGDRKPLKTAVNINFTAYQPTVNADETRMILVTGADNAWDNNDLVEVPLLKEISKTQVLVELEKENIDNVVKQAVTHPNTPESGTGADKNTIPSIYITPDQQNLIVDYNIEKVNIEAPVVIIVPGPTEEPKLKVTMNVSPNPFSEKTAVEINVPYGGHLTVQAYAMDGQLVAVLFDGEAEKGIKILNWFKTGLSNGIYTVKTSLGNNIVTKKVVVCDGTN